MAAQNGMSNKELIMQIQDQMTKHFDPTSADSIYGKINALNLEMQSIKDETTADITLLKQQIGNRKWLKRIVAGSTITTTGAIIVVVVKYLLFGI